MSPVYFIQSAKMFYDNLSDSLILLLSISILGFSWRKTYDTVNSSINNYHTSQNVINCIHAMTLATMTFFPSLENFMIASSTGFFIHDIFVLSKVRNIDKWYKWIDPLVLHHFVAMHALWNVYFGIHRDVTLFMCCILEISNIPMYMSTFCLKMYPNCRGLNQILLYNQFIAFTAIRGIYAPYHFFTVYDNLWNELTPLYQFEITALFFAGFIWIYKMGRKMIDYRYEHLQKVSV